MKPQKAEKSEPASRRKFDRTEALDVAVELFWRHGYEATSMAMLLKAMGLTAPSLYAAFGNKEQLFQAALERYSEKYGSKVLAPLAAPITAREAIEQMLLTAAATVSSSKNPRGCLVSFGAINAADHESLPVTSLQAVRTQIGQRIRERLERAVAERELPRSADTARLARFYHAVLGGLQLRSLDGASHAELQLIARDAMASWPETKAR